VNGLLLAFDRGAREPRFWELFGAVQEELDAFFWCFLYPPWMGAPERFDAYDRDLETYPGEGNTSIQLWKPGTLGRWANAFSEEQLQLWAIHPASDYRGLTEAFSRTPWSAEAEFIRAHAQSWLFYTDRTCWEIYARDEALLARVGESLSALPVHVHPVESTSRETAFREALGYWPYGP
jgi:hypothetical protein